MRPAVLRNMPNGCTEAAEGCSCALALHSRQFSYTYGVASLYIAWYGITLYFQNIREWQEEC